MRHSPSILNPAAGAPDSSVGHRLPVAVRLYVDEVFDRTIVALHALLKPLGIDVAKTKFAPGFMAELAAVVQVSAWEDAGLRHLIPLDFPPAATAMSDLVWRYHVDPTSFMDPAAGTAVFNRVAEAWAAHCHPDAREMLGCDIVMCGTPCPADQASTLAPVIMAIAERSNTKEQSNDS